jgi:hypothetical protein
MIEYVKEVDSEARDVVVKFLVRYAGVYNIKVVFEGGRVIGSPFRRKFEATFIDGSKSAFLRPSSTLVCIAGLEATFQIQPKDKYGNDTNPFLHRNKGCNFHFILKNVRFTRSINNVIDPRTNSNQIFL